MSKKSKRKGLSDKEKSRRSNQSTGVSGHFNMDSAMYVSALATKLVGDAYNV
jgi:hypothetical protein